MRELDAPNTAGLFGGCMSSSSPSLSVLSLQGGLAMAVSSVGN